MASYNKFGILVRNMNTSAVMGQLVKSPIQVFGVEGRYATALYSAATKMKQLDAVEKDLRAIQDTMREDPKLRECIISPIIKRKVMSNAMKGAAEQLHMSPTTSNLLQTLADNGRLKKLDGVINAFKIIMAAHRGEVVCEVITAKPLEASQRKELEAALKSFLKSNELLQLTTKVDPNIIGGMIVSVGDKYVDMSIASKVKLYTGIISASA